MAAVWSLVLAMPSMRGLASGCGSQEANPIRLRRRPLGCGGVQSVGDERVERTAERDFYALFGEAPIPGSRMTSGFGLKALGAVGTNRNWNTAITIARALDTMAG